MAAPLPPQSLSDGSFLSILNSTDPNRCKQFCEILDRISDNLEFTQSLAEYFATDDMLEPALMLITETLRKDPNLRKYLHGGSFASNAMVYRHRASPRDHDLRTPRPAAGPRRIPRFPPGLRTHTSAHNTKTKQAQRYKQHAYGYCFRFQNTNDCEVPECIYMHKCSKCNSISHGECTCPDK